MGAQAQLLLDMLLLVPHNTRATDQTWRAHTHTHMPILQRLQQSEHFPFKLISNIQQEIVPLLIKRPSARERAHLCTKP